MTSKSAYVIASLVAAGGVFFMIFLMGAVGIRCRIAERGASFQRKSTFLGG